VIQHQRYLIQEQVDEVRGILFSKSKRTA